MLRVGPQWGVTVVRNCPCMLLIKKTKNIIIHEFHGKVYQFETSKRICIKVKIKKMK